MILFMICLCFASAYIYSHEPRFEERTTEIERSDPLIAIHDWELTRQRIEQLRQDPPTQERQQTIELYQKKMESLEKTFQDDAFFQQHVESSRQGKKPAQPIQPKIADIEFSPAQEVGMRVNLLATDFFNNFNGEKAKHITNLLEDWFNLKPTEKNSLTDSQKVRIKEAAEKFIDNLQKINLATIPEEQLDVILPLLEKMKRQEVNFKLRVCRRPLLDETRAHITDTIINKIKERLAPQNIRDVKKNFYTQLYARYEIPDKIIADKAKRNFINNLSAMAALSDEYLTDKDKKRLVQTAQFLKEQSSAGTFDSYWKTEADLQLVKSLQKNLNALIPEKSEKLNLVKDMQKAQETAKNPLPKYKELLKTKPITLSAFTHNLNARITLLHNFWQEFPKIGTSSASRLAVNILGDILDFHNKALQEFKQTRASIARGAQVDLPRTELEMMNNLLDQTRRFSSYFDLKDEVVTASVKKKIGKLRDRIMKIQDPKLFARGYQILDILKNYSKNIEDNFSQVQAKAQTLLSQPSSDPEIQAVKNKITKKQSL